MQLPGWAWQPLEAGTNARPYSDLATRHAAFGSGIGCGIHLRPVPCVLPVSVAPLFATALAARGGAVPAGTLPAAQALARAMRLPGLPRAARPTPAHESDAIWNIRPASPWSQPPAAAASALALPAAETRLPRMTARPARPALPAQWRVRSIATAPVASAAAAVACADTAAPPSAAPALAAMMLEAEVAVALPAAGQPRPPSTDLAPRERPALPCAAAGPIPRPSAGSAGQSLALPIPEGLGPLSGFRHEADPLDTQIPAAAPRAAAWRAQGPLAGAAAVAAAVALPVSESAGFTARGFAALPPRQATLASRHLVPAAMPVSAAPYAFRQSAVSIPGIELPALAGSVPLDVYVQRVRSAARRDCEWRPVTAPPVHQPAALPDLWPVRFEQQVLQDWRRRQPRKSAESNPAAAKVQVMPRRAGALARLGARTSQVVKGLAAAAAITAILWIGAASKQTHGPIGARGQWLRNTIAQRATVVFDDDFRSGLNLWEGRKNWAQSWSHSPDGFVRTGQLALYRPSMKMTDYRLEFFAQIENKSVGWVARARDEQNYYAMKLAVTAPGPRPLVSIVRYPVTAGKKGKRVQVPLPIMFHNNTPYRVAVDVKGNRFRAFIEGQEIDSWQDDRLRAGGVGFFSENGEHARLYWVKVSNHTDWLGRLCGMIAGQEQGQAWERGNPAAPAGSLAAADSAAVLDAGKIADKKRGAGMLPFTAALLAGAR